MGVLTDFVLANASDAQRLGDHREDFEGLDAKGLGQVQMGTLYAILSETAYDPSFMISDDSFSYTASEDGPWVQPVPDDMVRRLASLSDDESERVAELWSKTEEFDPKYSSWNRADIDDFLEQIRPLAARAVAEGKVLFMWSSL
jgi:hypothetical protein